MRKKRVCTYVACEEVNMIWDEKDVLAFDSMWNQGINIFQIAESFDRDPDEVVLLVLDRARKGYINHAKLTKQGAKTMPKHGTRPTLKQKEMIQMNGLNPADFLVEREVTGELALINKKSGLIKILKRNA